MEGSKLQFFSQLAKGIAQQFGSSCEVVVHDLERSALEQSIVAIENAHVSGRKVGDGPSPVVLQALQEGRDQLACLTKTRDGKLLRSSVLLIRDDQGKAVGVFAIQCDISLLPAMESWLQQFTGVDDAPPAPAPASRSVTELLDALIEQSIAAVGKPAALMTKADKIQAVRFLNDSGAFLITKSSDKVCKIFGISKYTLYKYIDEVKE